MAEPQAKNELGQLFIDFGTKGFPTLLKSLNTVSAQFLLGKNAANQFVQTLTKPFKEAGNSAVSIGKMSNALATSTLEYQKLSMYLKKYNLSDSLLGDIKKLETEMYNWGDGTIDITGQVGRAFGELKLNFNDYKGTFEDTMKFLDDVQNATSGMSKNKRNQLLNFLGLNTDWGYLWDKGGRASDFATISDSAVQANMSLQESMNELKNTAQVLTQELLAKIAPSLEKIANILTDWLKNFQKDGGIDKTVNAVKETKKYIDIKEGGKNLLKKTPIGTYATLGTLGAAAIQGTINKAKGQAAGGAAPVGYIGNLPDITDGAELPPNLLNKTQNITNNITNDITITGNNADEIANKIKAISEQDIQYTQYQANNLPGI